MAQGKKNTDVFAQEIEKAIESFSDPAFLGEQSLLAAPYFLGSRFARSSQELSPTQRGEALQLLLTECLAQLPLDLQQLLKVAYLERDPHLNFIGVARKLGYSTATYSRKRSEAVEVLAQQVIRVVNPPLRAESPIYQKIYGRDALVNRIVENLEAGNCVTVTGESGMGKSSLGAAVARKFGQNTQSQTFWFTMRKGFNDELSHLLFSFAYFLRQLGGLYTWRHIAAQKDGVLDLAKVLGLIRKDLESLQPGIVMLCVDETEVLDAESSAHAAMLHFLDDLKNLAPVLMLGQKLVLPSRLHVTLDGIELTDLAQLLNDHQVTLPLTQQQQQQLLQVLHGNPAYLRLAAILLASGENLDTVVHDIAQSPSAQLLIQRVWQKLHPDAQAVVCALSVFQNPCPADVWAEQQTHIQALLAIRLVQEVGINALQVHAQFGQFAQSKMSETDLRNMHLIAAHTFESRGSYTSAAFHYLAAQQTERAIWLWFCKQDHEIEMGQGAIGLKLFKSIPPSSVKNVDDRKALILLRSRQFIHSGTGTQALEEIGKIPWAQGHPATPLAETLRGRAYHMLEQTEQALAAYRTGLNSLIETPEKMRVDFHTKIGHVRLWQQQDLHGAMRAVLAGQFEVDNLRGSIEDRAGNYEAAHFYFKRALEIAPQIENSERALSIIYSKLGDLCWRQNDWQQSIHYLTNALQLSEQLGLYQYRMHDKISLSAVYIVSGQYDLAYEAATSELSLAESLGDPYAIAGLRSNGSEACYYLHRYDEAEQLALRSLATENDYWRSYALTVIGMTKRDLKEFDVSANNLIQAVQSAQAVEDPYAEAAAHRQLAETHLALHQPALARASFAHALTLYERMKLTKEIGEITAQLANLDE